MGEGKKNKKCFGKKNLMMAFASIRLSSAFISAMALLALVIGVSSVNQKAKYFNECIQDKLSQGNTISESVHFCNGGN